MIISLAPQLNKISAAIFLSLVPVIISASAASVFCGFSDKEMKEPVEYPVACSPQAWACGSIYLIIQSLLDINLDVANNKIYLKPILPDEINKVEVKNLKIGDNRADFTLIKEGNRIKLGKAKVEGSIELIFLK